MLACSDQSDQTGLENDTTPPAPTSRAWLKRTQKSRATVPRTTTRHTRPTELNIGRARARSVAAISPMWATHAPRRRKIPTAMISRGPPSAVIGLIPIHRLPTNETQVDARTPTSRAAAQRSIRAQSNGIASTITRPANRTSSQ
jgi:hypothetical protein